MVYQIGDISDPIPTGSTAGQTLNILEINPALTSQTTSVQAFAISSQSSPLYAATAGSVGDLSLSNNGTLLSFGGWTTNGTAQVNVTVKGVGTLDPNGNYSQPATYSNATANVQIRSAYSGDGVNWYFGDKSGIFTNGGTAPITGGQNTRAMKSFGGTTYALTANGSAGVMTVTPSSPSSGITSVTYTPLPGLPALGNGNDFYMVSSGQNGAGVIDTLYATDSTNGIDKFALVGGSWTAEGTLAVANITGIAAVAGSGGVNLYVTEDPSTGNSILQEITDSAAYNSPISGSTPVTLYTAPSTALLRGVSPAPVATPEPASAGALGLCGLALLARRRSRR